MGSSLCKAFERLRTMRPIWGFLAILSLLLLGTVYFQVPSNFWANQDVNKILGVPGLSTKSAIVVLSAIFGVSLPFFLIVCPIREAVIKGLVAGYKKNFLSAVLPLDELRANPLILVKPTYGVLDDVRLYQKDVKAFLHDNKVTQENHVVNAGKDDERTLWKLTSEDADRDATKKFIYIDLSRNLTALKDIVDSESGFGKYFDRYCSPDHRYTIVRDEYFECLEKSLEKAFQGRIKYIDWANRAQLLQIIKRSLGVQNEGTT